MSKLLCFVRTLFCGCGAVLGTAFALQAQPSLQIQSLDRWDGLTLDSDVTLQDGDTVAVLNGLTVNATLTFASAGNATGLNFAGGSLLGTGQVIFGNTGVNFISSSAELTLGSELTIRGGLGRIDARSSPLTNGGTIIAEGPQSIITLQGTPFTDRGTLRELNGGKIVITP